MLKTLLICHSEESLNRSIMPRWMASFSDVVGIVCLEENPKQMRARIKREIKRVGRLRFLDVIAFRLYYRLFLQSRDLRQQNQLIAKLAARFPEISPEVPIIRAESPNLDSVRQFIAKANPDLMIARCKALLKPEIFQIPRLGTYVMHPGICPEYRNAHGGFWAMASQDYERVGTTLLRIDQGIDTGPIFGHYYSHADPKKESHLMIQNRTTFENLDEIRDKLLEIAASKALPVNVAGRKSANWGQPWLTRYLKLRFFQKPKRSK